QARVTVHDRAKISVGDLNQLQKTGHAHELGAGLSASIEHLLAESFQRTSIFAVYKLCCHTGWPRPLQSKSIRFAGNHSHDLGLKPATSSAVDQILQRCATAANQHRQ